MLKKLILKSKYATLFKDNIEDQKSTYRGIENIF